ncbi:MAG: Gfo/Idh/MocA family oxidoreductase [Saprospiraceae bacterium]|nr:Gfo/Idh/MocA family oxidoreductase [Bacteroidia bacterium]NNL91302.1 Gfo/Idh/MocA family oxidoreductase [Saprospiraceae bacterium]
MALNWGIVGLGKIAGKFVTDLSLLNGQRIVAVASRSHDKAKEFLSTHNLNGNAYGSYQALFNDPNVDIIYIATPHHLHCQLSIQAMECGKHVLCEKPLGVNRSEVKKIVETSHQTKRFMMEALWSRFNPSIIKVKSLIDAGEIGEVSYINADFCHLMLKDENSRLFNPELAGGALLDIGIYPVFLAYLILGMPQTITANGNMFRTGVDTQTSMAFKYKNAMATLFSSFESFSDMVAKIYGTKGNIYINKRWHEADGFVIEKDGEKNMTDLPIVGKGYTYEIQECDYQIAKGNIESNLWSHKNSLELVSLLDEIRNQIGLVFPFEK